MGLKKSYFQLYSIAAQILMALFPIGSAVIGVLNILNGVYFTGVIGIIVAVAWFPILLITLRVVKNNGIGLSLLELSNYELNEGTTYEDFHLTKARMNSLDALFKAKLADGPETIKPFSMAREIAVEARVTPTEFLYLLTRASATLALNTRERATIVDRRPRTAEDDANLKAKLEVLKRQLEDSKNKAARERGEEPPSTDSTGGKYDFL